jgi:hypothetical protein
MRGRFSGKLHVKGGETRGRLRMEGDGRGWRAMEGCGSFSHLRHFEGENQVPAKLGKGGQGGGRSTGEGVESGVSVEKEVGR